MHELGKYCYSCPHAADRVGWIVVERGLRRGRDGCIVTLIVVGSVADYTALPLPPMLSVAAGHG